MNFLFILYVFYSKKYQFIYIFYNHINLKKNNICYIYIYTYTYKVYDMTFKKPISIKSIVIENVILNTFIIYIILWLYIDKPFFSINTQNTK